MYPHAWIKTDAQLEQMTKRQLTSELITLQMTQPYVSCADCFDIVKERINAVLNEIRDRDINWEIDPE